LYQAYGDTAVLRRQYASMKAWVDHIRSISKNNLWKGGGYGDWLAPDPVVTDTTAPPVKATPTDLPYISQCWFGYSTQLLINAAKTLGKKDDVIIYTALF